MKDCKVCGESKPLADFTRDRRRTGGRTSRCKSCHNAMTTAWRQENPNYLRTWYLANRPNVPVAVVDGAKPCSTCTTVKPLEEFHRRTAGLGGRHAVCKVCRKAAHRADPEATRAASRARREANPGYMRQWRAANRERLAEYDRQYKLHIADCDYSREYMADLYTQIRTLPCTYCHGAGGEVDHVIPLSRGGKHEPENLASACRSCNGSKGNRLLAEWDGPPKLRYVVPHVKPAVPALENVASKTFASPTAPESPGYE